MSCTDTLLAELQQHLNMVKYHEANLDRAIKDQNYRTKRIAELEADIANCNSCLQRTLPDDIREDITTRRDSSIRALEYSRTHCDGLSPEYYARRIAELDVKIDAINAILYPVDPRPWWKRLFG